jgi:acetoin utilization deacetylase AcuC-like enzyme
MLKVAWNKMYCHPLPDGHRFPMEKYLLLPEQLLYEGTLTDSNFFNPRSATKDEILEVHDPSYLAKLLSLKLSKNEIRATGFPLSEALVKREFHITGGTIQAVDYALKYGIAGNIAGGTHHAYSDRGEGFCLFNDIAVGARHAIGKHGMKQILVVDLDVHQGNGTARIFENDHRVYTFSMHGDKNYPLHKERSDLDIPLPDGTEDAQYLDVLEKTLPSLLDRIQPELVFYQSGVDVLKTDKLGRLGLTIDGCKQRDKFVFKTLHERKVPVVFNMGGGYSLDIKTIVEAHANTYRQAQEIFF